MNIRPTIRLLAILILPARLRSMMIDRVTAIIVTAGITKRLTEGFKKLTSTPTIGRNQLPMAI
jgi:hypothetical protein